MAPASFPLVGLTLSLLSKRISGVHLSFQTAVHATHPCEVN